MTEQEFYSLYKKTETVDQRAKRMKEAHDKAELIKDKMELEKESDYE